MRAIFAILFLGLTTLGHASEYVAYRCDHEQMSDRDMLYLATQRFGVDIYRLPNGNLCLVYHSPDTKKESVILTRDARVTVKSNGMPHGILLDQADIQKLLISTNNHSVSYKEIIYEL